MLHRLNLLMLVLHELIEGDRRVLWLEKVDEQRAVVFVVTPDTEQLKSGLRADAESLTHEHARHHDVVLPVLIRLDALVVVLAPSNGRFDHLLDA